jgi:putative chitinase
MNKAAFFDTARAVLGVFTQQQVDGLNSLLAQAPSSMPVDRLAASLATTWHETAKTMQPIHEIGKRSYFDKYEPGTRIGKVLGNTIKGDGYKFRGRGYVQLTGRRNYAFASGKLGADLLGNPDKALEPTIAAKVLYMGADEGWFTGKKLSDYLDGIDEPDAADLKEFIESRRVINGTDKAKKIAAYALGFEKALREAGWGKATIPPPPDIEPIEPKPRGLLRALIDLIISIFKRKD